MDTNICPMHPNRMATWVGDVYVCAACSNGEPPDVEEKRPYTMDDYREDFEERIVEC
jgi:hypothetical protein